MFSFEMHSEFFCFLLWNIEFQNIYELSIHQSEQLYSCQIQKKIRQFYSLEFIKNIKMFLNEFKTQNNLKYNAVNLLSNILNLEALKRGSSQTCFFL